ncbi:isochorismatase domain-containing protein 2 [Erpetoichthys calabaricus]|uniref:isochorismatase domain-containing protein 2 n=1 Tax=Erpetoichthys calabaricus TaxID=27687 RepID=UPI002234E8F1|nr:isochorismatase domain-containing protein 2 [Erpetoichthys calabaricus]XP_028677443.2 isochorismatase domain-containing protein 2 [Erpetoichthys calabaricus]XP_051775796.1 isochorismatase domain-containing protein 2 [Erpetoichthys calabaricus]
MSAPSKIGRLSMRGTVLLLCDMQEKFRPNIVHFGEIVSNAARLLQAFRILGLPHLATEQYPRGLGPTVPELGAQGVPTFSKTTFSMLTPEVEAELSRVPDLKRAILCGIEAQACIACTALDLMERGLQVHLVADACSSRTQVDQMIAMTMLKQNGAFLTTVEGAMLQLVRDAAHPNFKEIQQLITKPSADTGLLSFFQSPLSG